MALCGACGLNMGWFEGKVPANLVSFNIKKYKAQKENFLINESKLVHSSCWQDEDCQFFMNYTFYRNCNYMVNSDEMNLYYYNDSDCICGNNVHDIDLSHEHYKLYVLALNTATLVKPYYKAPKE